MSHTCGKPSWPHYLPTRPPADRPRTLQRGQIATPNRICVNDQNYDSKKPSGFRNICWAGETGDMRAAPIAVGVSGGYGDDDRDRTFLWGKGGAMLVLLAWQ